MVGMVGFLVAIAIVLLAVVAANTIPKKDYRIKTEDSSSPKKGWGNITLYLPTIPDWIKSWGKRIFLLAFWVMLIWLFCWWAFDVPLNPNEIRDGFRERAEDRRAFAAEVERIRNLPIDPEVLSLEPPEVGERTVKINLTPDKWKRVRLPRWSYIDFSFEPAISRWIMRRNGKIIYVPSVGNWFGGESAPDVHIMILPEKEAVVTFTVSKKPEW